MPRALFVERFGDIFEHSPQIAEEVHRAGLTREQDTVDGLHAAFLAALRGLSREDKLALIRAHPELAGSEAEAGRLTEASTGEQGRLGFNALSPAEFARVADINRRYREAFGMPLVVALARHASRDTVLAELERRLTSDVDSEIATAIDQIGLIARGRLNRIT